MSEPGSPPHYPEAVARQAEMGQEDLPVQRSAEGGPEVEKQEVRGMRQVAYRIEDLPPLKEGYVRVLHSTNPNTPEKILSKGLVYEQQGYLDSTARSFGDEASIEYYVTDPRFSWRTAKTIVLDVPLDEHRRHTSLQSAPGFISPEYIVGVIEANPEEAARLAEEGAIKAPEMIPYMRTTADYPKPYDPALDPYRVPKAETNTAEDLIQQYSGQPSEILPDDLW